MRPWTRRAGARTEAARAGSLQASPEPRARQSPVRVNVSAPAAEITLVGILNFRHPPTIRHRQRGVAATSDSLNGGSSFQVTAAPMHQELQFNVAKRVADRPLRPAQREEVNHMTKLYLWALARQEEGQTMAEYGVVLAVITLLIVGTLTALSGAINGTLSSVAGAL